MSVFKFVSFRSRVRAKDLVTHANSEDRSLFQEDLLRS